MIQTMLYKRKVWKPGGSKSAMWGPYPPWHRISLILHMYGVVNDLATNHHTGQFDGHCVFFKSLKTHGLIQSKTLISVRLSRTYRLAPCNASVTAMGISKKVQTVDYVKLNAREDRLNVSSSFRVSSHWRLYLWLRYSIISFRVLNQASIAKCSLGLLTL